MCKKIIAVFNMTEKKQDIIIAIMLGILFFFLAFFACDDSFGWGDDNAAYLSEAISISEDTFKEQARKNAFLHPEVLPKEAENGLLVYVRGYPLALSVVYRLVGFAPESIFWYHMPTIIAYMFMAIALYYLARRRMGMCSAVLLTVFTCGCSAFYTFFCCMYSDLYFVSLEVICFALQEYNAEKNYGIGIGIVLGIILWLVYETRLTGIAIVAVTAVTYFFSWMQGKNKRQGLKIINILIPFFTFLILKIATENILLLPATKNIQEMGSTRSSFFWTNLKEYINMEITWLSSQITQMIVSPVYSILSRVKSNIDFPWDAIGAITKILCVIVVMLGVFCKSDKRKQDVIYILFLIAYTIGAGMYPAIQGTRYIFPVFPIIAMLFWKTIDKVFNKMHIHVAIKTIVTAIFCGLLLIPYFKYDVATQQERKEGVTGGAFTENGLDMFRYIKENTQEDDIILFFKPRAMNLLTDRLSFCIYSGRNTEEDADYCVVTKYFAETLSKGEATCVEQENFIVVYDNPEFTIYKNNDKNDN